MGAPIFQPDYTSKQVFTDGSVAARPSDLSPWQVICGPDLAHHDTDADCEAASFADRQNRMTSLVFQQPAAPDSAAATERTLP